MLIWTVCNDVKNIWKYIFSVVVLSASEAPKEAPVRKYLPSSVYLEEKTDEQKKEEVKKN